MTVPFIVGPDTQGCAEVCAALIEEANHKAAEAFLAGRMDHGALWLRVAAWIAEQAGITA